MLSATHRANNWRIRRVRRAIGRYRMVLAGDGIYRVTRWSSLMHKRLKALKQKGKRK